MLKEVEDARGTVVWAAMAGIMAVHSGIGLPAVWCYIVIILMYCFDRKTMLRDKPYVVIAFAALGLIFIAVKGRDGFANFGVCIQIGVALQLTWRVFQAFRAIRREKNSAATS